nr:streptolysin associated protein SagB [Thermoanaerobaculia bacterium]
MSKNERASASPAKKKTAMSLEDFFANELPPLSEIVTFCNTLPMSLYADTTGVKSPEVVYRGLMLSQNRLVAEEYLLNSRRSEADLGVVIGTNNYTLPM